ncbi:MAG: YihY/virulence factor BrkB family protein [Alphaproteobacteria bacterium]|jgi:membrane protein|nr:YihY/virulence factor BrkB family protein [Alphaproteobacteria bacterium]
MAEHDAGARSAFAAARIGNRLLAAARRLVVDGGLVMAGHLAFVGLLALFPFLIFLTALAGFFGQTELGTHFVAFFLEQMPEQVAEVLYVPILEVLQETRGGLLTLGILLSIWTASSGLEAARISLDRAYFSIRQRPMWQTRIESMLLVILAASCILVAMLALVLGPVAWTEVQRYVTLPRILELLWNPVRYGFGALLILSAVSGLFFLLPAARLRLRWVLPGAVLVMALWLATAIAFSYYVSHFGSYTVTYGSLAGIILTLLFFYLLAVIFIFGAEFNAALARAEGGLPPPRRRKEDREADAKGREKPLN